MDRVVAPVRERPLRVTPTKTRDAAGVVQTLRNLVDSVTSGELGVAEAQGIAALCDKLRLALETKDHAARLSALEAQRARR